MREEMAILCYTYRNDFPYKRETPAFECKRFANQFSVVGGH